MSITDRLDELVAMVENARAMPMSASCIVNRAEMVDAIEALRSALPDELTKARGVLRDRSAVVDEGRVEAQVLIDEAKAMAAKLVARTEVVKEATREAERLVTAAEAESERMRHEVDDYVDAKLANFEIVLHKTLSAVEHGRNKIHGRHSELEELADSDELAEPLPG